LNNFADEEIIDEPEFQQNIELITGLLNELPGKYRTVINLHVFEHMGFEEIAVIMEVPSST